MRPASYASTIARLHRDTRQQWHVFHFCTATHVLESNPGNLDILRHSQKNLRTILTARSQLRCICEQLTGPRLWTVEVLFDGQGRMYLDKGWENFAIAHGVDFGCFVHFKYEGDDVLTVKVFDGTMCRKYYYSDDEDTDDESDDDVKPCIHPL
ncbi:hypothetical protein QYE76_039102 [Lolium multiflorum]|uniref:TF-B3 domain-containing protein n=1 Tax=Lolium multiflorum TaxID=4521 RepID=A0AAD8TAG8_LOLMU|nr:hypothetical protein QYE76_039102 [Lolium multiflorum]